MARVKMYKRDRGRARWSRGGLVLSNL